MALHPITDFSFSGFKNALNETIPHIVDLFLQDNGYTWWNILRNYRYDNTNWEAGQQRRLDFHHSITQAGNHEEFLTVCNEILRWGKMKPLSTMMQNGVQASIGLLKQCENGVVANGIDNLCIERIASITKVYEMWNPREWIIYDSYCAKGLQYMVSQFWNNSENDMHRDILLFPWPPGRVGRPLDGFPRLATPRQGRLAFFYGSWLCKAIAEKLNQINRQDAEWDMHKWETYHIEMVAFQLGHEFN